jgi:ABC-2 type transport system ATP-binding protein
MVVSTKTADRRNADRSTHLALEGVTVDRGRRRVLEGLSFEIERGEIFGLLGPNGAGKSTAFQVLTGLLPARAGRVVLDGVPMAPGDRRIRSRLGVVFQDPALDPRLSVTVNLQLAARLQGVGRSRARERIADLLDRADLTDRADEPVRTLSGGMKRRVEIARALVHEPSILVLDEPTTGLDEASFRSTWETLDEVRRSGETTMVLTTHRPDEAEYCDRIAIMDHGRLVACDTPDRLRRAVRGDLLVLEADDPESVSATLRDSLEAESRVLDGKVVLEQERAHEWIPRIVEALPEGSLRSVSLRRAGLGEVFLELTGHELRGEERDA